MAKACGKCDPHEICEECPEWIFTLADLIMCMMGLFVLLWVLKPSPDPKKADAKEAAAQEEKWLDQVGEIRAGFGWTPDPTSSDPVDRVQIRKREKQDEGKGGRTEVPPQGVQGSEPEVKSVRPGKHAIVGSRIIFEPGKANLPTDADDALNELVRLIQGHRQIFQVKGHTAADDFPEGATPEQKMNLSVRRAQAVADFLTSHGVEADVLRVQGCSSFEPVAQRAYSNERRALNRRVEVEGTDTPVNERQDAQKTTRVLPPDLDPDQQGEPVPAPARTGTAEVPLAPADGH